MFLIIILIFFYVLTDFNCSVEFAKTENFRGLNHMETILPIFTTNPWTGFCMVVEFYVNSF